ncbi:PBP1A family penicillin-binding protein [Myxococcota bacterium]|nr:PBP1A family penicillin-binding protein [Myxococcota bacterium]
MQTGQDDLSFAGRSIERPTQEIKTPRRRLLRWFVLLFASIGFALLCFVGFVWWACRDLPDLSKIQNYRPWGITRIVDRDGQVVAEFADQRRTPIPYSEMPRHLIQAVVAAEDADFFKHKGLDYTGILRAFWKNLWRRRGSPKQGGSTITQQVVKTFLLTSDQFYIRKIREAVLARQLEQYLKKEEILYLYLNQIYFGRFCYGVEEAARFYFHKSARQLNLSESAILAGVPKNPERYNPAHSIPLTERRRRYVLRMMLRNGWIDPPTFTKTLQIPILRPTTAPSPPLQDDYYTDTVRRETLKKLQESLASTLSDPTKRAERARELFYRSALRIETPLDTALQIQTQQLLAKHLQRLHPTDPISSPSSQPSPSSQTSHKTPSLLAHPSHQTPLQGAVVLLEPHTRLVRALVGGNDYRQSPFNRAVQARRPPGSAFKPILYAAAIESRQYTAASLVNDAFFAVLQDGKRWIPQNNNRAYSNRQIRIREALAQSINTVAVRVMDTLTPNRVIEMAQRLGIHDPLEPRLPLALGASAIQPLALTNAYATFAAQGVFDDPALIERILDSKGHALYQRLPNPRGVLSSAVAYVMTSMLEEVVKSGTAQSALRLARPIAGKTGTTNQTRDAWFVGYSPQWCAGIWIGFDDRRPIGPSGTGSLAALPLFLDLFSLPALRSAPALPFPTAEELRFVKIDPKTGYRAPPDHPAVLEVFLLGTEPRRFASSSNLLHPDDFSRLP